MTQRKMSPLNCQCTKSLMAPSFSIQSFSKCASSHLVLFLQILPLWTAKSHPSPKNTLFHLPPPYSPLPHLESSSCLSSGSLWSSTLSRHMKSGGTSCICTLGAPVRHLTFSITVCLMWSRYCEIETNKKKLRRWIQLTTWIKPRSLRSPEMF